MKVRSIMNKKVVTVKMNQSIKEACRVLIKQKISGVPVVNNHKNLVGFVSERDIIHAISTGKPLNRMIKDIMTKAVHFLNEDMLVENIPRIFLEEPFRYLPIVKGKKVVGIISRKEMIEKLMKQYY